MRSFAIALAAVALGALLFVLAAPVELHTAVASFGVDPSAIVAAGIIPLGLSAEASARFGHAPIFMAPKSIEDLEAERADILAASEALIAAADEAEADISDEDLATIEENKTKVATLDRQIAARRAVLDAAPQPQQAGQNRRTPPDPQNRGGGNGSSDRRVPASPRDSARHGFLNMGEFAMATKFQSLGQVENESVRKLLAAATTYGNEGTGTDGGFLVPPEFSRTLWQKVEAEENLMSRCTELTPSGNSMSIPKDETTPWGSGGVQVYWEAEGAQGTASKAALQLATMRLYKLFALVPASDELVEDAMGYESYLQAMVPGRMSAAINTAIFAGTGAGQPLGMINAPSLISVAKETSQPADTVWFANIQKMWGRMYAPWRRNAVWLINQDVEASLEAMAFQPFGAASMLPTAASTPVYLPPGGLADAPYGRLKGRPVIPLQACKTIGEQGDIVLVDLKQYWILRKAAGLRTDTSMHLYFDQALTAFRFIFRINGQPMWSSSITPQNGSNTLSWAVALDAR